MPTCLVLMCTYNGERFLREQIDSILAQRGVEVFIKAADDRSSDGTVQILEEYRSRNANFDYYVNSVNKNFTYNFIDLLFSVRGLSGNSVSLSPTYRRRLSIPARYL